MCSSCQKNGHGHGHGHVLSRDIYRLYCGLQAPLISIIHLELPVMCNCHFAEEPSVAYSENPQIDSYHSRAKLNLITLQLCEPASEHTRCRAFQVRRVIAR